MAIDQKTRSILTDKCRFTSDHITKLENDTDLQTRATNLLNMFRRSPKQPSVQNFVKVQLRKIRQDLDDSPPVNGPLLQKARAEYYTFH